MKHFTLLKLAPGADALEVQHKIKKAYQKLDDELDWANAPVVYRCCDGGTSDMDLMAIMELDAAEQLPAFLEHPIHTKLVEQLKDEVAGSITFDHY